MMKKIKGLALSLLILLLMVGCANQEDRIIVSSNGSVEYYSKMTIDKDNLKLLSEYEVDEREVLLEEPTKIFAKSNEIMSGVGFKYRNIDEEDHFGVEYYRKFKNPEDFNEAMSSLYGKGLVGVSPVLEVQEKSTMTKGYTLTVDYKYLINQELESIFRDYDVNIATLLDEDNVNYTLDITMPGKIINKDSLGEFVVEDEEGKIKEDRVVISHSASNLYEDPQVIKVSADSKGIKPFLMMGGLALVPIVLVALVVRAKLRGDKHEVSQEYFDDIIDY